jgi:hypothetical protein
MQPWPLLDGDFPRMGPDLMDKLSSERKFGDKLSEMIEERSGQPRSAGHAPTSYEAQIFT